jgi:hypothetical protein
MLRAQAQTAPAPQPTFKDPLELFAATMPVFTHPRCTNCHGVIDPRHEALSRDHEGGFIREESCTSACHTAEQDWNRVATGRFNFTGLDSKGLCLMQQRQVRDRGTGSYLNHLSTDKLVEAGFQGLSAGAAETEAKPPMEKDEFIDKVATWIQVGGASCASWEGVITQTESLDATYEYAWAEFAPPSSIGVIEEAERVLTLESRRGATTLKVIMNGHSEVTRKAFLEDGCQATYQSRSVWSNRDASPQPASLRIQISHDGQYAIRFEGIRPETTVQRDNESAVITCTTLPPGEPMPDTVLEWDPWRFTISCPPAFTQSTGTGNFIDCEIYDAERMPRLKGSMTRTIHEHEDAADPQSWLRVSPASGSRLDTGKSIPVKVITTWDFQLVE